MSGRFRYMQWFGLALIFPAFHLNLDAVVSDSKIESRLFLSGKQTIAIGASDDSGRAMAYESNGKIVITGPYNSGSDLDLFVVRLHANGALDTSFGSDGLVTRALSGNDDISHAVGVDSSSRITVAGGTDNGADLDLFVYRFQSDGNLDTTFDVDGLLTKDIISNDFARALTFQTVDGTDKLLVFGTADQIKSALTIRLNSNGTMDTTFDIDGIRTTLNHQSINAGAVQIDQKIVTAGSARASNGSWDYSFGRLNTDGSVDTTFDVDGWVTGRIINETLYSVALQQTGHAGEKIVATGISQSADAIKTLVVRLNTNGSIDTTFDVDGINTNVTEKGRSIFVLSNEKITISGFTDNSSNLDIALLRYNTNGALDTSFSNDGLISVAVGTGSDVSFASLNGSDSRVLLAGKTLNSNWDLNVLEYDYFGAVPTRSTLDNYLETDGTLSTDVGGDGTFNDSATNSHGNIIAVGDGNTTVDLLVANYRPDGTLDTSFGTDGISTLRLHSDGSSANAVAIDNHNRPIVGGYLGIINVNFALTRFLTNGSLDTSFGIDGIVTTEIGTRDNVIYDLTLDSSQYIYVAGMGHDGTDAMIVAARYNTDGSLDTTFSIDGILTSDIDTEDMAFSVAMTTNKKVILTGFVHNGTEERLLTARILTNGTLDTTFDNDGIVTQDLGSVSIGYTVSSSEGAKVIASGYIDDSSDLDFVVIRQNSNGSMDTSFASDGIYTIDIGSDLNIANGMALQTDQKIFVGGFYLDGSDRNYAMIKLLTNGQVDTAFDTDGLISIDMSSANNDEIRSITIEPNSATVVAAGILDSGSDWDLAVARYFP